jgi:hypothetical protein
VFLQNSRRRLFSIIIELFFYRKSRGVGPRSHGPGPRLRPMSPQHSGSISVVGSLFDAQILMKTKGYPRSNLGPWSKLGRLGIFFLHRRRQNRWDGASPWPAARWAQAHPMVHHLWRGVFLCDLCDEKNPICPLTTVETTEGKPAMRERLGRPSIVVGTASGGAPAPGTPLAAVV